MIMDSLSNIPLPPVLEVKIEKNSKAEEPRAIEEPEKGDKSQLDMEKQNISKKRPSKEMEDVKIELETYTATNGSSNKLSSEEAQGNEYEPVNIVV